jgi:hypothetical protein
MDEAEGAVARADDDDDIEVTSGPVAKSKAGAKVRQRDKSSALKNVTPAYGNKLAYVVNPFRAWKVFRDSLGTSVMNKYPDGYGEGEVGLNTVLAASSKVQGNKAKNDITRTSNYAYILILTVPNP